MSETPILDLERDPPKPIRPWISWVIGGAIGVALVRWITIDFWWWLPVLYVSIAFHEIGHMVAGLLMGMPSGGIMVGGISLFKSGERWVWRFQFRNILSGGLAKPLPRKGEFDSTKYAWMVAGGPIATLLLAGISGLLLRNSNDPPTWLSSFCWINLFLLLSTMMPSNGINKSDIPSIWRLLHDPEASRSWAAVLQVQSQETAGVLPRDWDPELVALMLQPDPKTGDNLYRQMLGFYRRIDEGDEAAALLHLERALAASSNAGRAARHWCFLEASCSSALLRHSPSAARTWMTRAVKVAKPVARYSIDAAIAQSEHRYSDALQLWDASLAYLAKRKVDSGLVRFVKARIAEYQEQCRAALSSSATA